ncbi:type II toxin-antitoxin system VapC family toxin [Rhodococcus sp. NPDC058514]|uniref:type II toxin-antitoxin system VapC family toxin n=1 Tax=unclassified Rhodococcus (in: high G+C Gram-positive bacteria) TaxID=192944 RepID=UPI00364F8F36
MIYLDTSAMVKLVVREAESDALARWLNDRLDENLVTSTIGRIELLRAAGRVSSSVVTRARSFLSTVDAMSLTPAIAGLAETIGAPALRTLDALHLAAVYTLGPAVTTFVVYDQRLAESAIDLSIPVAAPGI